jgi:hypothetical protein
MSAPAAAPAASNDPRTEPGYKAKRHDERVVLLLGAILDALLAQKPKTAAPALPATIAKPSRARE